MARSEGHCSVEGGTTFGGIGGIGGTGGDGIATDVRRSAIIPYLVFNVIFGPLPEPYFPARWESPDSVFDAPSPGNSEFISQFRQSATISRLAPPGTVSAISPEEFVICTSSFGAEENLTPVEALRLSIITLPPGFSKLISESRVRRLRFPGASTMSIFPEPVSMCPTSAESVRSVFEETMRTPFTALSTRTGP